MQKMRDKFLKNAQIEKVKAALEKKERELYILQVKHSKQDSDYQRFKTENIKL